MRAARRPPEVDALIARLGPDPLRADADPERAWHRIQRSTAPIAALLMDQAVLAGVGNVYRAEVLFRNEVAPMTAGRAHHAQALGSDVGRPRRR